jgi:hypothetical protein
MHISTPVQHVPYKYNSGDRRNKGKHQKKKHKEREKKITLKKSTDPMLKTREKRRMLLKVKPRYKSPIYLQKCTESTKRQRKALPVKRVPQEK